MCVFFFCLGSFSVVVGSFLFKPYFLECFVWWFFPFFLIMVWFRGYCPHKNYMQACKVESYTFFSLQHVDFVYVS